MKEDGKNKGKELILQKCFELLLQKGYDAVSISDIQNATGMSRGLIYHYYAGKEELFMEIIDRYFLTLFRFETEQTRNFTIREMIAYVAQKYTEICVRSVLTSGGEVGIVNYDFLFYQTMLRNPDFARRYRKVRDDELNIWRLVVRNSWEKGELEPEVCVDDVAKTFIYLIDGTWFNEGASRKPLDMVQEMARILLHYFNQIRLK